MKSQLDSLVHSLFSRVLVSDTKNELAFAIVKNNEYIPKQLKDSNLLLLITRKDDNVLKHRLTGLYISSEQKYAKTFNIVDKTVPLPNIIDTADITTEVIPLESWEISSVSETKTYFSRNCCKWVQNTIVKNVFSYIIAEIPNKPSELLFSKGLLTVNFQENSRFKKLQKCKSVYKYLRRHI